MKRVIQLGLVAIALLCLSGCPDDDGGIADGASVNTSGNQTSGGSDSGGSSTPEEELVIRMGSFNSSGTFQEGVIATNDANLLAGESVSLVVSLVDQNGDVYSEDVDIFFTSGCISAGTSEVNPPIATSTSGTVSVTYTARGCDGSDEVMARTSVGGNSLTATVTLQTQAAELGTVDFVSASPELIGIKGTGALPGQSVVTFKVTNAVGGPVANQDVTFSLNSTVGGVALSNQQGTTNAEGLASTTVNAGTVATSVRVTAQAVRDGKTSSAQSSALVITTGLADSDSFSISAGTLNIEGLAIDGTTTPITIRASDRYNNPVPDDTAITFSAEGGSVDGSCLTVKGVCEVTFTSQDPRPSDGRVTVLAHAVGEETFLDTTPSNGEFDDAELASVDDLPEAFQDDNENGVRDNNEIFVDFVNPAAGSYNNANGKFDGLLCSDSANNCGKETVTVFENIVIVLSGSSLFADISPDPIDLNSGQVTVSVKLYDVNGQVPPAETTIVASTSQGKIDGPTSYTMPSTATKIPPTWSFTLTPGAVDGDGTFRIEAETPSGLINYFSAPVDQTP